MSWDATFANDGAIDVAVVTRLTNELVVCTNGGYVVPSGRGHALDKSNVLGRKISGAARQAGWHSGCVGIFAVVAEDSSRVGCVGSVAGVGCLADDVGVGVVGKVTRFATFAGGGCQLVGKVTGLTALAFSAGVADNCGGSSTGTWLTCIHSRTFLVLSS